MLELFVMVLAALASLKYNQLIALCWLNLFKVLITLIILVPSLLVGFYFILYLIILFKK